MDKRMSLTSTSYYVEPTLHSENNTRNDGYYGLYAEGELHVRQPEGAGRSAVGVDEQRGAVEVEVGRSVGPAACPVHRSARSQAQVCPVGGTPCAVRRAEVCPFVLLGCAGSQGLFACGNGSFFWRFRVRGDGILRYFVLYSILVVFCRQYFELYYNYSIFALCLTLSMQRDCFVWKLCFFSVSSLNVLLMKEFRNLESLVKELECELLKEEDQALLFVGKGDEWSKTNYPQQLSMQWQ